MPFSGNTLPRSTALLTLLGGTGLSLLAGYLIYDNRLKQAEREFAGYCDEIVLKAEARLEAHKQVLLGGAALFDASANVTRDDWRRYAERLRLDEHFKGILGFGFARKLTSNELAAHEASMRREGFPHYAVWPPGKRELYGAIVYIEPFSGRNLRAFGYDMYSEQVRRQAMARAMNDNTPALSGKVHLVQETSEDVQAGTLMYVPVYRRDAPIDTLAQRQAALQGWVYSPFRMKDMLQGTVFSTGNFPSDTVRMRVYDGALSDTQALLYDSQPGAELRDPVHLSRSVLFNGSTWTLDFDQSARDMHAHARQNGIATTLVGLLLTLLLYSLIRSMQNTQQNARRIADTLTQELQEKSASLAASEERLGFALSATGEGLWDWDIANGKVMHNAKWSELLGITPPTLESDFELFAQHLHEDDRAQVKQRLADHLGRGLPYVSEHRMRKENGDVIWVQDRGQLVKRGADGTPLRMIGSIADVTERKLAQLALSASEDNLRRIFANSPEGVLALSLSQQITFCNDRLLDLFALERKPDGKLTIDTFIQALGSLLDLKDTRALRHALDNQSQEGSFRLRDPKRVIRWESRQLDSDELHTVIFFRDITREVEIDEMKSDFLATAAHELRAPMSSIYGFVELMLTRPLAEEDRKEYLQIVYEQTRGLIRKVNELLDLTRIEARAGRDFRFEPQQTAKVMRKALQELNLPQDTHPVRFAAGEDGMPDVRIDADKIKQVFVNVLSNAWKYSPHGGAIEIRQKLEQREHGDMLAVTVTDHGIGMSKEHQLKAFDRFFRADTSGVIPGTGLGLSLVKEIMQIHGGSVTLDSRPGAGTSLTLRFPIDPSDQKGDA